MKSPDQKHNAELQYESEIRFGPSYFKLSIDGVKINNKYFGHELKWSNNSQYLATEEWLTTDYQKGPVTRVSLFDVALKRVSEFQTIEKGFAKDFCFEDSVLVYKKHYSGRGIIKEVEIDIKTINNWVSL